MKEMGLAVATAKVSVMKYIHSEYETILKELTEFDTPKEELENQTKEVIKTMDKVKDKG